MHDLSEERNRRQCWSFLMLHYTQKEKKSYRNKTILKAKKTNKKTTATKERKNEKATKQHCQTKTNSKVRNGVFYDVHGSNCS